MCRKLAHARIGCATIGEMTKSRDQFRFRRVRHAEPRRDERLPELPRRPSGFVWLLHWVSAILVLFLLLSVASGLGLMPRLPANWMNLHLSAGVTLLALSLVRLLTSRASIYRVGTWKSSIAARGRILQGVLLLLVLTTGVTGLLIYQAPALGRGNVLFGSVPMPTLVRLDHTLHGKIILAHIVLSLVLLVILVLHVLMALRRDSRTGQYRLLVMLWPWRTR